MYTKDKLKWPLTNVNSMLFDFFFSPEKSEIWYVMYLRDVMARENKIVKLWLCSQRLT